MNSDERRPTGQPDVGLTGEWDEAGRDGVDDWGVDDPDWDDVAHDDDDYDEVDVNDGPAARRRAQTGRRRALLLALLVVVLIGGGLWAWRHYQGSWSGADPQPSACVSLDPDLITPDKVTLNVYNSTTRTGLAASVAKDLKAQGFVIAQVANDPLSKQVAAPAEVRHGPAGKAHAALVMTAIGEGAVEVDDGRADTSVDVALGTAFSAIQPVPTPSGSICPTPSEPAPSPTS